MLKTSLLVLIAVILSAAAFPSAAAEARNPSAASLELARLIERRASATDFNRLQDFGRAAMGRNDREGLERLNHVAWIFLNQGEYATAQIWNDRLRAGALRRQDRRYVQVARLNELVSRYYQGDTAAGHEAGRIAATEPDWFARAHATRIWAWVLIHEDKIGDALELLTDADAFLPRNVPYVHAARGALWEVTGIAMIALSDFDGSTAAFLRSEIEFDKVGYPRPDFDTLYNLSRLSAEFGEPQQAQQFYLIHHRLATKAGLPQLEAYDAKLCAEAAEALDRPRDALRCLARFSESMSEAVFLAPRLLPVRAVARAQTGQLAAARRDLERARALKAEPDEEFVSQMRRMEAEILFAEGRSREAYEILRRRAYDDQIAAARRFSAGMNQITGNMQQQLAERRAQLETERANAKLQGDVIATQRWMMIIAVIFTLSAVAVAIWLSSQAKDLRVARRRAEDANRSKSEFLANMSHEIRTPLNGVVAMADALSRARLRKREHEMVDIIRASSVTLERLLSDILDSAKIEAGEIVLERSAFDLGDTVRGVAALYRPRADEKGLALELQIDPSVEGAVEGDVVRVRQVLSNLISNALKFTEAGAVSVSVAPSGQDRVRFTVVDTGCGFDEAQKARLFARFQQADGSITRRFGGTGLGLAISQDLAQLMGGTLDCEGRAGQGAAFWFDIPLPRMQSPAPLTSDGPVVTPPTFPKRVLLADDHPANRKVMEIMLNGQVDELTAVEDGAQALEAFRKGGFDLVLMDMQMPVMDGLTACAAIRAVETAEGRSRTPLIMLTANALPDHVAAARRAGADGHLAKPITLGALFDGVAAVLQSDRPASA